MKKYIEKINTSSYNDYFKNKSTSDEVKKNSTTVFEKLGILLDESYLNFLIQINGFGLNGLNFYGTKKQSELYVLGALEENEFWRAELRRFDKYYIVGDGDGDMEFYCCDPLTKRYIVFDKATDMKYDTFNSFQEFMDELIKIYV